MNFKQIVQDYFTFSRNERKGITILLVIIFLLAVANKVIFYFETPAKIDAALLDTTRNDLNMSKDSVVNLATTNKLFRFNPNTINRDALDSLSLPDGVKRNILKFREKGGKFYSETDFRKIYGLTDSIYDQLEPFLMFENKTPKPALTNLSPLKISSELFPFDPNAATDKDFTRFGFTEKQIKTIRKYQSKGGNFRSKVDFFKIYGISESQKIALADYVIIEEKGNIKKIKNAEVIEIQIEINVADSIELMKLPGIGDKLSKRIVKYRDLLGGFYTLAQLKEVYGLSEKVIQQIEGMIKVDRGRIHKVDLNFADWNELAKHPYIQKNLARQIVKFRTKYGSIHEPSVLRDSMILNIDEYTRLKPYL
jgi:competence ComEA-like helix-hairpin-helix protein